MFNLNKLYILRSKKIIYILPALCTFSVIAGEVHIKPEVTSSGQVAQFFGYDDGKLATNFDTHGERQDIIWKDRNNHILSEKPYYYPANPEIEFTFCIDNQCSAYTSLSNAGGYMTNTPPNNDVELTITVNNASELKTGVEPISTATFEILEGEITFLYQAHLDQNGDVLSSMWAEGVSQTVMTGLPLTSHVRSLSACSLGAFSTTEPVVIEECTENYPVKIEDIVATDDTYSEKKTGDTVHGNEDKLIVKNDPHIRRDTYLKFPLDGLNAEDIERAEVVMTLKFYDSQSSAPDPEPLDLSYVYSNDWTEETLTYDNEPDSNSDFLQRAFLNIAVNQEVSWEITDSIQDAVNQGRNYISLKVSAVDNGGYGRRMDFYSKESGVNGPVLRINNDTLSN